MHLNHFNCTWATAAFPWAGLAPSELPLAWYVAVTAAFWVVRGKVGRTGIGSIPGTPGSCDPSAILQWKRQRQSQEVQNILQQVRKEYEAEELTCYWSLPLDLVCLPNSCCPRRARLRLGSFQVSPLRVCCGFLSAVRFIMLVITIISRLLILGSPRGLSALRCLFGRPNKRGNLLLRQGSN